VKECDDRRAAQPGFGVEGDTKVSVVSLRAVQPDKTERHLPGNAV
jgi:hypothetical protein